ncbi:MAG: DUF3108 domain-containing protein [Luteolibacter sp.]
MNMIRLFTAITLLSLPVSAAPAWEAEISKLKTGSHPPIPSSTLDFKLSWKGMLKAGTLRMEFSPPDVKKPGSFVIKSSASSIGVASSLFPYSHSYWSEIDPKSLDSKYFNSTETGKEESVETTNRYSSSQTRVTEKTTDLKTKAISNQAFVFGHGQAHDLFSAILKIRSQRLAPGDEYTLLLLPFTSPYLLKVKVESKEKHMGRDTLRMSFAMQKIDRKSGALRTYKKLKRPVTLWLTDDADRIPLELRAEVYIGDVRAVLTGFKKNP